MVFAVLSIMLILYSKQALLIRCKSNVLAYIHNNQTNMQIRPFSMFIIAHYLHSLPLLHTDSHTIFVLREMQYLLLK